MRPTRQYAPDDTAYAVMTAGNEFYLSLCTADGQPSGIDTDLCALLFFQEHLSAVEAASSEIKGYGSVITIHGYCSYDDREIFAS